LAAGACISCTETDHEGSGLLHAMLADELTWRNMHLTSALAAHVDDVPPVLRLNGAY